MTTYSLTDYATRSLRVAGLIGSEEVPSAADLEDAMEAIQSDSAALLAKGIVIWNGNETSVPIEWLAPGARYHAISLKNEYGMIGDVEAEQTKALMEQTLRTLSSNDPTGVVQEAEYF